ncbi:MAG: diaminopimelate decarboxylase [Coriobacteriales bacterium]|jgi:diaminopimelate decarboxylase|nr:diaminopimelate decarboxylase [Coriobacteriales bacterium]
MAHIAHNPDARPDYKTTVELGAVLPQTAEVRDGHLYIGGLDTVALAQEYGTALYVMDETHIRTQLRNFLEWTRYHWKDVDVAFAGKAFLCRAMCQLVAEEGCYLDVASGGELACALAAGFPPEHILAHGNNKTIRELTEAIDAGVGRIVVDSFEELARVNALATERAQSQAVLIRVTPGIVADTHAYIQTGGEDSKFGFGLANGLALRAITEALELDGIELVGLHMHIGSQIFALNSYAKAIEVIVHFMDTVRTETGFTVAELDTGGGLGIAYGVPDEPATIKQFGKVIVDDIKEHCEQHGLPVPHIIVEPGRSVAANAGVTLYTVGTIKRIPEVRTYVAVDGGMTDNIRTALYDAHYEAVIANRADAPRDSIVTVAGKHCESGDIVLIDAPIQTPVLGDVLCVFGTGAYCQSMASNYNKQVRPAVVFVRDGAARLVVRRETYEDLMRCDVG